MVDDMQFAVPEQEVPVFTSDVEVGKIPSFSVPESVADVDVPSFSVPEEVSVPEFEFSASNESDKEENGVPSFSMPEEVSNVSQNDDFVPEFSASVQSPEINIAPTLKSVEKMSMETKVISAEENLATEFSKQQNFSPSVFSSEQKEEDMFDVGRKKLIQLIKSEDKVVVSNESSR